VNDCVRDRIDERTKATFSDSSRKKEDKKEAKVIIKFLCKFTYVVRNAFHEITTRFLCALKSKGSAHLIFISFV